MHSTLLCCSHTPFAHVLRVCGTPFEVFFTEPHIDKRVCMPASTQSSPPEEGERLQSISSLVLEEPSFLLLRNSLRYQFTRSADVVALAGGSGSSSSAGGGANNGCQGIESIVSSNLVNVLRGASAGSSTASSTAASECSGALVPSGFSEALRSTAIDFVVKVLSNRSSCSKPLTQLPQTAEQRHALASRLNRDSMVWCTRGIDTQLRARWTRAKKNVVQPPAPSGASGSASPQPTSSCNANKSPTNISPPAPQDPLGYLVHAAQREWRALINVRVESLKILTQYPLMRSSSTRDNSDGGAASSTNQADGAASSTSQRTSSSGNGAAPALTVEDLLGIVVERINGAAPAALKRRANADDGEQAPSKGGSPVHIENLGYFTSFHSAVHLIVRDADVVPTLSDLRECLADLDPTCGVSCRPDHNHLGVPTAPPSESLFLHLVDDGDRPDALCTHAISRGIPPSLRRLVYAKLLHLPLTLAMSSAIHSSVTGGCSTRKVRFATANSAKALAESAQQGRLQWNASQDPAFQARQLIRQMVATDVASRVGDSDKYFVFADETTAVATALLEDRSILDHHLRRVVEQRGEDPRAYVSAVTTNAGVRVPACGVMPFAASTTVLGPLNYVTGDLCEVYELAAAFQGQLWSPLQSATVDLLGMMLLFEQLVAHFAPAAVFHCNTKLSLSPLAVSMRWMVTGFADIFEPAEVLMLWDVLVGVHCRSYFGLTRAKPWWVLAAAAAAVFSFRGALVLQCFTASQVFKVFEDGVKLSPIPLLQQLLFLM